MPLLTAETKEEVKKKAEAAPSLILVVEGVSGVGVWRLQTHTQSTQLACTRRDRDTEEEGGRVDTAGGREDEKRRGSACDTVAVAEGQRGRGGEK